MYKFYIPKKDLKDATDFYVGIIRDALKLANEDVEYVTSSSEIKHDDVVLTITLITFVKAWLKKPQKQIHWFQGITPEEIWLLNMPRWKKAVYSFANMLCERFVLKKSWYNLFVSQSMVTHYRNKYGYKKDNLIIMPCFNSVIDTCAFTNEKYSKPTFVYAGNMAKWQCVEKMLELFKKIQTQIPSAELYLFTKEVEKAKSLLSYYKITAQVRYVPYQEIGKEMSKMKYGFLIREDIEINRVATPTKMNTYLASGIIPVFSDVIGDFKIVFQNMRYAVPLDMNGKGIEKLLSIERETLVKEKVLEDYSNIFNSYYSPDYYKKIIKEIIIEKCPQ